MRFLPSFETKASEGLEHATAGTPRYVLRTFPYLQRWNAERAVKDGFERVIWVFRGIDAIAMNGARLPIRLREEDRDSGPLLESPQGRDAALLRLLNKRPNEYETAFQFRYRLLSQLVLSKAGVFVEWVPGRDGKTPAELHLLPPDRTNPVPGRSTDEGGSGAFVDYFELQYADGRKARLDPERILWIRRPHPIDPYNGATPLEAAGISIDLDFYARLYNRNFVRRDGRPGGIVAVKGRVSRTDSQELQNRFSGGPEQAGRTSVIEAEKVSYIDMALTPRDLQYVQSLEVTKHDILEALGTPESVLGYAADRTFDNADAEENIFWRATMRGYLDLFGQGFDPLTDGGVLDDKYVVHDTSSISVLQRDERERHAKLREEFQAGLITADQYLEQTGQDPMDVPGSRVLWIPTQGKTPVGEEADVKAATGAAAAANGNGGGNGAVSEDGQAPTPASVRELERGIKASDYGDPLPKGFAAEVERYLERQDPRRAASGA